jgi:predicted nucleotidyltransferase
MSLSGISHEIIQSILATSLSHPKVQRVILYGSRARGDYHQGSDIDIAIDAPDMNHKEFVLLWNELDDLPIIYPMDIVHIQALNNTDLLKAIQQDGQELTKE